MSYLLAALGCSGVQVLSGTAMAAPCVLELAGPERVAWQSALAELGRELERGELSRACRSVHVDAANGRATLVFVARDGRRAERDLLAPAELVPSVQALSATAPALEANDGRGDGKSAPSQPERDAPSALAESRVERTTARAPSRPAPHDAGPEPRGPYASKAVFGASIGFRTGADDLISPALGATAALLLDPWELGLLGRFEGKYVDNGGGNDSRPETSGMALGVTAGRRESIGAVSLRTGAALLFADLREEGNPRAGRAEARVGWYGGGTWPEGSWLALRVDLGAEIVPYNIGVSETNAQGDASLPWWAISFAVGPEFR